MPKTITALVHRRTLTPEVGRPFSHWEWVDHPDRGSDDYDRESGEE